MATTEPAPCRYSVVVPCYHSAATLDELVSRIGAALEPLGAPFEVLLVNDASPDDTWQVICRLAECHTWLRGIDLMSNSGQFRAVLCGLERACGQIIVLLDDDLQHPPEEIPGLIQALEQRPDLDCVMGRYRVKHHGWLRNLGSGIQTRLNTLLYGKPRGLVGSSFQAMTRDLAAALCRHGTVHPILNPLIYRTTRRLANVPVRHEPRRHGRSGYGPLALLRIVTNNVLSASTLPLRLLSGLGFAAAGGSIILGIYYFWLYMTRHITVPGFVTLVLLVLFFGGMTLLAVGLVGEYLIRIMDEVRRPPRFVVRATVGEPHGGASRRAPDETGGEEGCRGGQ